MEVSVIFFHGPSLTLSKFKQSVFSTPLVQASVIATVTMDYSLLYHFQSSTS